MSKDIWAEAREKLIKEYLEAGGKKTGNGKSLNNLECPSCGKREAYALTKYPEKLSCNRKNKCGWKGETDLKVRFSYLFENVLKSHPPTKNNPKATAKAFLKTRGLNPDNIDFEQGKITVNGEVYQSVGFRIDKDTINHRLIDWSEKDKTRNYGEFSGKIWKNKKLNFKQPIYVTEAVLDSLSLIQGAGYQSVSCLSASHLPKNFYQSLPEQAQIVIAFDNDKAGIEAIYKHRKFLIENCNISESNISVELPPSGKDWNDLLQESLQQNKPLTEISEWKWNEWRGCLLIEGKMVTFEVFHSTYSERYYVHTVFMREF